MKQMDIATAVLFLLLAGLIVLGVRDLDIWTPYGPGPALAAYCVGALLALIGLLMLVEALAGVDHASAGVANFAAQFRVLLASVALVGFAFALPRLGFLLSSIAFMTVMLLAIQRRPIIPSLAAIALTVGVAYGVFVVWLGIDLPKGDWGI